MAEPSADDRNEWPALVAIVVGILILAATLLWPALRDDGTTVDTTGGIPADEPASGSEEPAEPDLALIQALLDSSGVEDLEATADGTTVILAGPVPNEEIRQILIDLVSVQPGVGVVDASGLTVTSSG
jgi:hypothetical protein